jgi:hypothetical protein
MQTMPWAATVYEAGGSPKVVWVPEEQAKVPAQAQEQSLPKGWRSIQSGTGSSWCDLGLGGKLDCTWSSQFTVSEDAEAETQDVHAQYLRLAAIFADHTRGFMMDGSGPNVGETRRNGYLDGDGWRAMAIANFMPCAGAAGCHLCEDWVYMTADATRDNYDEVFIVANHEYGHAAQWWQDSLCTGGAIAEGFADGFLSALTTRSSVRPGTAGYNGRRSIEVVEEKDPGADDGLLELAGSMLDMWDTQATEQHPGHTFSDPANGLFDDIWQMWGEGGIDSVCEVRSNWISTNRPQDGNTIMAHDGVTACP